MTDPGKVDDLEIYQNLEFQRRNWLVERVAWIVLGAIVAVAMLGLFGNGVLGTATAATGDGTLTLEYERFWRKESPMTLRVRIEPPPNEDGRARVWLDRSYLDAIGISYVMPEPESVVAGSERLVYEFVLAGGKPVVVAFAVEAIESGRLRGRVGLENGAEVEFAQFIYP